MMGDGMKGDYYVRQCVSNLSPCAIQSRTVMQTHWPPWGLTNVIHTFFQDDSTLKTNNLLLLCVRNKRPWWLIMKATEAAITTSCRSTVRSVQKTSVMVQLLLSLRTASASVDIDGPVTLRLLGIRGQQHSSLSHRSGHKASQRLWSFG